MPLKNESFSNSFNSINGHPVLILNISQDENIKADISQRFTNDYSESCTLNYKILKVE
jgi:hypothetical protein